MHNPIFVIIPTLNRPRMCARALDSLLQQDFAAWDCVIAKNGGMELLGSYVAELGPRLNHPRVKMLVLPDKGLGYALNQACEAYLEGHDYFANLEDDDEWEPGFLPTMYRWIRHTGADTVHCLQDQEPRAYQSAGGPAKLDVLRGANYINFPMCLFRASLWERVGGFSEEVGPATDWDWHLRCLAAGAKYQFAAQSLVIHHWHDNNYCQHSNGKPLIKQRMKEGVYG